MGKNPNFLTALRYTKYLGSHPSAPGQAAEIDIEFHVDGVHIIGKRGRELGAIPWEAITAVDADDRESLERRLTGPRLLLLGGLAFVAKKETVVSYLVVRDLAGDWVFAVPKLTQIELRSGLNGLRKYIPYRMAEPSIGSPEPSGDPTMDVKARLKRLSELRDSGLISDDEYSNSRSAIIAEL